jgi:WD40 repeat protein
LFIIQQGIYVHNGKCLAVLYGHTNWVRSVVFSSDDNILVSAGDDCNIRLWQLNSSNITCIQVIETPNALRELAFSPIDRILAVGSSSREVTLWNISESRCISTLEGHVDQVLSVAFNNDGSLLASSDQQGIVNVWNPKTGETLATLLDRPYEGMNITGVKGLNESTIASLKALGAIEDKEMGGEKL